MHSNPLTLETVGEYNIIVIIGTEVFGSDILSATTSRERFTRTVCGEGGEADSSQWIEAANLAGLL